MNLQEKLLQIQRGVDRMVKDAQNTSDKYSYVSSEQVLDTVRPLFNELGLLLIPEVSAAVLHEGATRSGTTRYMTELTVNFIWWDVDSGERMSVPFYAQGVDLAGEKGVGKALTYAEKYFLLKFFHVPTSKDDPDADAHTGSGEKRQRGTQAAAEAAADQRESIRQMLDELCMGDAEKIKASLRAFTKSEQRGYAGVDSLERVQDAALPVVYRKVKSKYQERMGRAFTRRKEKED